MAVSGRSARKVLGTGAILLGAGYLLTAPFAGRWMLERLASSYPVIPLKDCQAADAIAVLAGTGPPRQQVTVGEALNRMEAGVALYRAGKAPLLVAVEGPEASGVREVPAGGLVLVAPARNTAEEAGRMVAEARRRSWRRVILVTSGFHMGRALRRFRQAASEEGVGLTVIPFAADPLIYERWPPADRSFAPGISGWEYSTRALRELFGQVAF